METRPTIAKTVASIAMTCALAGLVAIPDTYLDLVAAALGQARQGEIIGTSTSKNSRGVIRYYVELTYQDDQGQSHTTHAETSEENHDRATQSFAARERVETGVAGTEAVRVALRIPVTGRVWSLMPNQFALDDDGGIRKFNVILMLSIYVLLTTLIVIVTRVFDRRRNQAPP